MVNSADSLFGVNKDLLAFLTPKEDNLPGIDLLAPDASALHQERRYE
jgi:hypothetical protein